MSQQNHFARVPGPNIQRSVFDRSSEHKTTFDAGYLIPFYVDEALPGDTFSGRLSVFARLATPLKPIMDNMYMDFHFWAVPYRLVWDNWQAFNGEREDPVPDYQQDVSYQIPHVAPVGMGGFAPGGIFDYMGIPPSVPGFTVCSLHMRAYNLIFNTWYRDQNLQTHATVTKTDSGDSETHFPLRKRNKRRDYFTSALPWPQKGPSVDVPIGTAAPVYGNGYGLGLVSTMSTPPEYDRSGELATSSGYLVATQTGFGARPGDSESHNLFVNDAVVGVVQKGQLNNSPDSTGLYADLSTATAATINQLRQAFQLQRMFERDARGGTRYTEIITSHFGVTSPDFRLQRPEYLGGGSLPININPVVQTNSQAASGVTTPQGNLSGFGIAAGHGIGFSKSFVEHTLLIGIVSVRANNTYQQGIPKMFTRSTREDFYWPSFAHLGEQPIYNFEIDVESAVLTDVFGYQERYAEYRYKPNMVSGLFRSKASGSLDIWHLAQELDATYPTAGDAPASLNEDFIMENPPLDRCISVPSEPHFIFDSHLSLRCARPMPVYSEPGLIDHF